jgi:hypothetical protein
VSGRPACRRCGAVLSAYRADGEPEGLCAACAAVEAPRDDWRVLESEVLVFAVAGVLASAAAERPGERVHVQPVLKARGILADSVDVHLAVEKLRRRHGWVVGAVEGLPGYRLEAWPHRFTRSRR